MYREFDACDPLARAPTPLPSVFESEGESGVLNLQGVGDGVASVGSDGHGRGQDVLGLGFEDWSKVKAISDEGRSFSSVSDAEPAIEAAKMRNDSIISSGIEKKVVGEKIKGDHDEAQV